MVYLLHGPDDFSIQERISEIVGGRNATVVDTDVAFEAHLSSGVQDGLFGTPTSVILREVFPQLTSDWLEQQESDVIIDGSKGFDKRTAVYKWIAGQATVEEFVAKDKGQVFAWAKKQYDADPEVYQLLWETHGSNLWMWHQELEKLQAYAGYDNRILKKYAHNISEKSVESNIFEFLDIFSSRGDNAAEVYASTLGVGIDEYYLFSMVMRQIRLLIRATVDGGLKGQHPFVVQKVMQQVTYWDLQELVDAHNELVRIDLDTKTGNADLDDEMLAFVIRYTG